MGWRLAVGALCVAGVALIFHEHPSLSQVEIPSEPDSAEARAEVPLLKERADLSPILGSSRYRVLGKLSADEDLIVKWLLGRTIPTRTP